MGSPLPQEIAKELAETAARVSCRGKGILAADESTGTIGKRFSRIGLENTLDNRANYRELLFSTTGFGKYISGVILYEETLFAKTSSGAPMVSLLEKEGVVPGIKADQGLTTLVGTDDEQATKGIDGLHERCAKYYQAGARFTKWRAVITIDQAKRKPSELAIQETARTLARYAAISQQNRLVPLVEPEVLSDGDHSIQVCAEVTERVLSELFKELHNHKVLLEGCLLKPNMVTPGAAGRAPASHEEISFYTLRTLQRTVPPALVGIHFLSGGQSEEESTQNLNTMNKQTTLRPSPWIVSFSYGRALQASCLDAWQGKKENVAEAQKQFLVRAEANARAQLGQYTPPQESQGAKASAQSLFEQRYVY